jgi:HD-like signal output (HDOD) protein
MSETLSFIEIVQRQLESEDTKLPPFDGTAQKIQQEILKEDPDVRLIEKWIVSDQALTGQVLRVANSSFYRGLVKVSTVRNAILRLGINEVSNIVTLVTQEQNYFSKDATLQEIMRNLWRHSVGCAIGAHWLAREAGFQPLVHEAFFAGLLHDVGKLFILKVVEDLKRRGKMASQTSVALLNEAMESLHAESGASLMGHWNLPQRYCNVARHHHDELVDPKDYLLLVVALSNRACHRIGIGPRKDSGIVLAAQPEAKTLGMREVDLARLEICLEDARLM